MMQIIFVLFYKSDHRLYIPPDGGYTIYGQTNIKQYVISSNCSVGRVTYFIPVCTPHLQLLNILWYCFQVLNTMFKEF